MAGWTHRETEPPATGAIGRFENLPENDKEMILQAIEALYIDKPFAGRYALDITDIRAIAEQLGYEIPYDVEKDTKILRRLRRARLARMMNSLGERRAFVLKEKPIGVKAG